jgi:hypothetical protein
VGTILPTFCPTEPHRAAQTRITLNSQSATADARDQMGPGWSYGLGLEARRLGCHQVWGHCGSLPLPGTESAPRPAYPRRRMSATA